MKKGDAEKKIKTVKGAVKAAEKAAEKTAKKDKLVIEEEKKGAEVVIAKKTDSLNK